MYVSQDNVNIKFSYIHILTFTITFDKSKYLLDLRSYHTMISFSFHKLDMFNSSDENEKYNNFLRIWIPQNMM